MKIKKDSLGDRMKGYESVSQSRVTPRSYTFLRVDGRAFHSYLKGSKKPFDRDFIEDMDSTAVHLCEQVQNAKLGYVQSDEITILLCDFENINTDQFFGGNVQKIASVVASMASSKFNHLRFLRELRSGSSRNLYSLKLADFDCRVWNVPCRMEAYNTFVWRNNDAARNSISMVAQSLYSHKELHGKSSADKQEMIFTKGINWNAYDKSLKNGRLIVREEYRIDNPCCEINLSDGKPSEPMMRTRWVVKPAEKFTQSKETLLNMIPKYE